MPQYRKPPPPGLRRLLWNAQIKFEGTFALAMLDGWERALCYSLVLSLIGLFWWSVFNYSPSHVAYLSRRFSYYVWDDERIDIGEVFKGWCWDQVGRVKGALGGAGGGKVEL